MIDVYYWTTPNGKLTMFSRETGLQYTVKPVNISRGEQFAPEFLAIAPNNRFRRSSITHRASQWPGFAVRIRARSCSISPTRPAS